MSAAAGGDRGGRDTFRGKQKAKDVRLSNIIAAKGQFGEAWCAGVGCMRMETGDEGEGGAIAPAFSTISNPCFPRGGHHIVAGGSVRRDVQRTAGHTSCAVRFADIVLV